MENPEENFQDSKPNEEEDTIIFGEDGFEITTGSHTPLFIFREAQVLQVLKALYRSGSVDELTDQEKAVLYGWVTANKDKDLEGHAKRLYELASNYTKK